MSRYTYAPFSLVPLGARFWSLDDTGELYLYCIKIGNAASKMPPVVNNGTNPFGGTVINAAVLEANVSKTHTIDGNPAPIVAGQVVRCDANEAVVVDFSLGESK